MKYKVGDIFASICDFEYFTVEHDNVKTKKGEFFVIIKNNVGDYILLSQKDKCISKWLDFQINNSFVKLVVSSEFKPTKKRKKSS